MIMYSVLVEIIGIKGMLCNVFGIQEVFVFVVKCVGINVSDILFICINEVMLVIGDVVMEIIIEIIIIELIMIGYNLKILGGVGFGVGIMIMLEELLICLVDLFYILVVLLVFDFVDIVNVINVLMCVGYQIIGVILQCDDGVLVSNWLEKLLLIVDEVLYIDCIFLGMLVVIEVVVLGKVIEIFFNFYGIVIVFNFNVDEMKNIVLMVCVLIGNCFVVVVKMLFGDVKVCVIFVGNLELQVQGCIVCVDVVVGVEVIMKVVDGCGKFDNVIGEVGINIGGMLEYVCQIMVELINKFSSEIFIQDFLVVDILVLVSVIGGLVGEFLLEQVVGIVLMVKLDCLQMVIIVCEIEQKFNIDVQIGGVEVEVVILGVLIMLGII